MCGWMSPVVCRDISTQVATEKELRDARRQAEAAVIAKSSFLANMSHEIRTPMNGVVGFAELLLAGALDDEQRRQAELIADSGRAMMQMLNDILDLSKVEAGQMTVSNEPFDIIDTLNACIALVSPAIEQKGMELQSVFSVVPCTVTLQSSRLPDRSLLPRRSTAMVA
jgi:signal transduction histidine kinase